MADPKSFMVDPQETGFGPPNMAAQLFGMISSLPNAYQQGVEQKFARGQMKRTEELQKPVDPADYGTMLQRYLNAKGVEAIPEYLNMKGAQDAFKAAEGGPPQIQNSGTSIHGQDPNLLRRAGGQPSRQQEEGTGPELGPEPPTGTVNPQSIGGQPQNLTGPTIMPPGGGAQSQTPNQRVAQSFPQYGQPQQQEPPPMAGLMSPEAIDNHEKAGKWYFNQMLRPGISPGQKDSFKVQGEQEMNIAKQGREQLLKIAEQTDPRIIAGKGAGKFSEGVGEAKGKRIGEVIEAGGLPGRQMLNTLNVMEDAFKQGGKNISTGPGAEGWLKVKQAANNLFPGIFDGVPESETVQKLNAQLAAAAAKAMTARPSQLEFRAFMANNPGLLTSKEGSFALINVLRQAKEQDLALSRMAMNSKNHEGWADIEDKFYAEHPIKSPFTGKPLTGHDKPEASKAAMPAPQVGEVVNDHRYLGGPLRDQKSWAPVTPAERT